MWGSTWNRKQRLALGCFVLFTVDVIWVASSEVSHYLFAKIKYDKPYFATYLKTTMFMIYLIGFMFLPSWHRMMCKSNRVEPNPLSRSHSTESIKVDPSELLSDPMFVPTSPGDEGDSEDNLDDFDGSPAVQRESEAVEGVDESAEKEERDECLGPLVPCTVSRSRGVSEIMSSRSVRFSELSEVRQMATSQADLANRARLSYEAAEEIRHEEERAARLIEGRLPIPTVAKLSLMFCILWFVGNYSYSMALQDTVPGVVNVLSSTCSLFTLILAAVLPSNNISADRFTMTKLVCVLISIGGVALVSLADTSLEKTPIPVGVIWALAGAVSYALYLVLLRRRVDSETQLSLPMFFGFVGMFNAILLWPGLLILDTIHVEPFVIPNGTEWIMLTANGLIGTVMSEILWLWGCFLTSSLLATLSLSLTTPMTMLADFLIFGNTYDWRLYLGSIPIFFSFIAIATLTHRDNPDPIGYSLRRLQQCVLPRWHVSTTSSPYVPRRNTERDANVNTEQEERLLDEEDDNS